MTAWWETATAANRQYAESVGRTMTAGNRFADAWMDLVDATTDQSYLDETAEAAVESQEIWLRAAEDTANRAADAVEGEEIEPERFRDIWLNAANRAFKNAMETTAFAALTGESVDEALAVRREYDEVREDLLHEWGLATAGDVREVGERLVELERRQQAVEERLDRVLDAVEEG